MNSIKDIAAIIASQHQISGSDAEEFISQFVDVINEGLQADRQVKIKGLGTFKLQTIKERSSVNIGTGERVTISEHDRLVFTPDTVMRDLVNKPFSQFETVMLDDDSPLLQEENIGESEPKDEDKEVENSSDNLLEKQSSVEVNPIVDAISDKEENDSENQEETEVQGRSEEETGTLTEDSDVTKDNTEIDNNDSDVSANDDTELDGAENTSDKSENDVEKNDSEENDSDIDIKEENVEGENSVKVSGIAEIPNGIGNTEEESDQKADKDIKKEDELKDDSAANDDREKDGEKNEGKEEENEKDNDDDGDDDDKDDDDDDDDDYDDDDDNKTLKLSIYGIVGALIVFAIGYYAGVNGWFGSWSSNNKPAIEQVEDEEPSVKNEVIETDTIQKASETDNQVNASSENDEENIDMEELKKKDDRIRTGAYDIVGIKKKVTVKEGETIESISKAHLGKDMECYIEVLNDKKEVKPGDVIKIPELKPKKRK